MNGKQKNNCKRLSIHNCSSCGFFDGPSGCLRTKKSLGGSAEAVSWKERPPAADVAHGLMSRVPITPRVSFIRRRMCGFDYLLALREGKNAAENMDADRWLHECSGWTKTRTAILRSTFSISAMIADGFPILPSGSYTKQISDLQLGCSS